MQYVISSSLVKIFNKEDCKPISGGVCLKNESFTFQIFITAEQNLCEKIVIDSDLNVKKYIVKKMKGNYDLNPKTDDYYIKPNDDTYPDLLQEIDELNLEKNQSCTIFFEIEAKEKVAGLHYINIKIGAEIISFPLTVLDKSLVDSDLIITHWVHLDCICNYYNLKVFSEAFYERLKIFLQAYVKMGNNMLLIPIFTPPLDTAVGGERLTTQLVKIKKIDDKYSFDFSELIKYINLAKSFGIKYFEFSHLFTQWGGKFCPKIIVEENGSFYDAFGWQVASDDPRYLDFLKQFFDVFVPCLIELGIKDNSFIHLTDEPNEKHFDKYEILSKYVRSICQGVKMIDALSHFEYVEKGLIDLPVVCLNSKDLDRFDEYDKLLYYCVWVDNEGITNRYFHMPTLRTMVLGLQLYIENSKGFLHWGYNFYNTRFSIRPVNPYVDATAGGEFVAGDSFIVYPGKDDVDYSLRYFTMLETFELYRLLKTAEKKLGREEIIHFLHEEGVYGVHQYPHDESWFIKLKNKLYQKI